MTRLTIHLSDERLARLESLARAAGVTPEEWACRNLEERLDGLPPDSRDAEFEAVAGYVVQKNAELYRRLA